MGIKVLDCTLRDGAYVTKEFNAENIINTLSVANIDIIECGWLKSYKCNNSSVLYNFPEECKFFGQNRALMFDLGKYDFEKLPNTNNNGIIRIAFYKQDLGEISFTAEQVKNKGYKVFLQASNTAEYTEQELIKLCKRANYIGVDAVYIVDSFGSMFPEDLDKIMPIYDDILDKNIEMGFHSHNNMQLSLGLTIQFINKINRNIIVDSSLCGIGRGAGNTKTELLIEYLNRHNYKYNTDLIWKCIADNITPLTAKFHWEYSPEMGYKGIHKLHPNTILQKKF